jgi:CubicO group peptidase (beta-lactamase class C family)
MFVLGFFILGQAFARESSVPSVANLDAFFFEGNETGVRQGKRTDSALIIQDGKTLYEHYARGYDENKKHIMWSTSKTALALLVGVAEKDGLLKRSQSICDFIKGLRVDICQIRIQDLLQWSSTLSWREEYENAPSPRVSSVLAMLYGEGHEDMAHFVFSQPLVKDEKPGEMWRYSSGDSIALAAVIRQIYKGQDLRQVYAEKLYGPLGMKNWLWESDVAGTLSGGYYFFVSTRDLAKLGEIFLNQGKIGGHQIVDADFIQFMSTVPDSFVKHRVDYADRNISGAHLWINNPTGTDMQKPWPVAPDDTVATLGHWGQFMIVIPSLKVIAVRTGDTRDHSLGVAEFVNQVMAFVNNTIPRPPEAVVHKTKVEDKSESKYFDDGILKLGLRFTAKNFCSCLFVTENTEANCRDYASLEQVSPRLTVDREKKQTMSRLFLIFTATATYKGPTEGCVLD